MHIDESVPSVMGYKDSRNNQYPRVPTQSTFSRKNSASKARQAKMRFTRVTFQLLATLLTILAMSTSVTAESVIFESRDVEVRRRGVAASARTE